MWTPDNHTYMGFVPKLIPKMCLKCQFYAVIIEFQHLRPPHWTSVSVLTNAPVAEEINSPSHVPNSREEPSQNSRGRCASKEGNRFWKGTSIWV